MSRLQAIAMVAAALAGAYGASFTSAITADTAEPGAQIRAEPPARDEPFTCLYPPTLEMAAQLQARSFASVASTYFFHECCRSGPVSQVLPGRLLGYSPIDFWGNEYVVQCTRKHVRVISAGPDGRMATTDDLSGECMRSDTYVNRACGSPGPYTPAPERWSTTDDPVEPEPDDAAP